MVTNERKILLISNGLGEDSIGAVIASDLKRHFSVSAMPIIGTGEAYLAKKVPVLGPACLDGSSGNRRYKLSLLQDLKNGAIGVMFKQMSFLKGLLGFEIFVVVGDTFPLALSLRASPKHLIFLGVYKSGYAHRYNWLDRWLLKKTASHCFTRDHILSSQLTNCRISSGCYGNILMDTLPQEGQKRSNKPPDAANILIMPGSRSDAHQNLMFFLNALADLSQRCELNVTVSKAQGLDFTKIYQKLKQTSLFDKIRETNGLNQQLLESATVILSGSGTSQQQAAGLGTPVIGVLPSGIRKKRKKAIKRIMGPLYFLVESQQEMKATCRYLMEHPVSEAAQLASKHHIGKGGALKKIIYHIEKTLSSQ